MTMSARPSPPPAAPASWRGAQILGTIGKWLVLALSCHQLTGGSWAYTYSVAPGISVQIVVRPGPDTPGPADPSYLEVIRGLTPASGWPARLLDLPDTGLQPPD
jgi:hypothetical protein